MFQKNYKVMLHHTDAAGVIYYGSLFQFIHSCYEEWLGANKISIRNIIEKEPILIPVIEANLRYTSPIYLENILVVSITFTKKTKFSFKINYKITNKKTGKQLASGYTIHACMSKTTKKIAPLPLKLVKAIDTSISQQSH